MAGDGGSTNSIKASVVVRPAGWLAGWVGGWTRHTSLFVLVRVELGPAALKEAPHGVAGHPHLRRVLVEQLAVVEDELSVGRKLLAAAVAETEEAPGTFNQRDTNSSLTFTLDLHECWSKCLFCISVSTVICSSNHLHQGSPT